MKRLLIPIVGLLATVSAGGTPFKSDLVLAQNVDQKWADDSGKVDHSVFAVWNLSAPDGEVQFVRGFQEGYIARHDRDGTPVESAEVFVSPSEMTGTLALLRRGTSELVGQKDLRFVPIHWPGGFHFVPETSRLSGHGPSPLRVGISIDRDSILQLVKGAKTPIAKVHGVYTFPSYTISDDRRSFRASQTFQLEVDYLISDDQSSVTVDLPVIVIDFPPLKIDEDERASNQTAEPTRTTGTPPASAGDRASGARGSP